MGAQAQATDPTPPVDVGERPANRLQMRTDAGARAPARQAPAAPSRAATAPHSVSHPRPASGTAVEHEVASITRAQAGMDRKTARKSVQEGKLPSALRQPRAYGTRPDPFEEDWSWLEAQRSRHRCWRPRCSSTRCRARYPGRRAAAHTAAASSAMASRAWSRARGVLCARASPG